MLNFFPSKFKPRPQQEEVLREIEEHWKNTDVFIIRAPVGCHAAGTEVRLADNTLKLIEAIQPGDLLLGPDGLARTVTHLHRGSAPMYKIIPQRGNPFYVTHDHILSLRETTRREVNGVRYPVHLTVEMTVDEFIATAVSRKRDLRLYRAPATELPTAELPMPPYILGLWLGDGTSTLPAITSMDYEILDAFSAYAAEFGLGVAVQHKLNNKAITIRATTGRHGGQVKNPITMALRQLKLLSNKHIPSTYMNGSIAQRAELLAGLIDTDGHYDRSKRSFELVTKWEHLAKEINYCFLSIGYSTTVHPKVVNGVTYWRVNGSRPPGAVALPTKLARKQIEEANANNNNRRFKVEYIGIQPYYGVTVDKDNLYLMDDYTVTHNCGKSAIAETVARYAQSLSISTTVCTPTNVLVRQYENGAEEGTFATAPSRSSFGKDDKAWEIAKQQFKESPIKLCNNYTYLALRAYSEVLILDEAHRAIPMLTEMDGIKLWKHLSHYPDYMPTILHFMRWAVESEDKRVLKLLEKLKAHPTLYTMSHEVGEFRGQEKELLNVRPLSPKNSKPVLWPGCVKKIFLMSATIGLPDIAELGLDRRRVRLIDVSSPIPAERRPIVYDPIGSMAVHSQNKNMDKLVKYILDTASVYEDKGLIHCTYGLAAKLRPHLAAHPRLIFHTNLDKAKKLKQWLNSPPEEGKILVACGLTEGLDVKGDLGRWQIICKIMFPDQADIAVAEKMRQDIDWYAQQAIRELEQAVGRICRSEDDFGVSFIIDSCFAKLYTEHKDKFSISFKDALC